jgi:hypothetical protein
MSPQPQRRSLGSTSGIRKFHGDRSSHRDRIDSAGYSPCVPRSTNTIAPSYCDPIGEPRLWVHRFATAGAIFGGAYGGFFFILGVSAGIVVGMFFGFIFGAIVSGAAAITRKHWPADTLRMFHRERLFAMVAAFSIAVVLDLSTRGFAGSATSLLYVPAAIVAVYVGVSGMPTEDAPYFGRSGRRTRWLLRFYPVAVLVGNWFATYKLHDWPFTFLPHPT